MGAALFERLSPLSEIAYVVELLASDAVNGLPDRISVRMVR